MDIFSIIYVAACLLCSLVTLRYDMQMFQLCSYRYSRYFRWWFSQNILTHRKWWLILVALCMLNGWLAIVAVAIVAASIYKELSEKYKTPIVFTNRVKRLYTTAILMTLLVQVAVAIAVGVEYLPLSAAITLMLSNFVVLSANVINTPIEKYITQWYINDAKRIIESHKSLTIIGVTGSFGKTSTKNYLAGVLSEKYNVLVTPGNFNTLLGVVRTIREHLRPYHQVFIVEMGAKQQGDIKEICDLVHPQIGILTAVGEMHLETFKSFENIQKTKFELIDSLPADGLAILNYDSPGVRDYGEIKSNCRVVTYGVENEKVDLRANDIVYGANGVSFTCSGCGNDDVYSSKLLGSGNLLNLLASIAVSSELQVPVERRKSAVSRLRPVEHRLSMRHANGITVLDDAYNSNPTGAAMAIDVLKGFAVGEGNKRIIITPGFVEMGARQFEANKALGKHIARGCDYAIIVNVTNREAIVNGIAEGGFPVEKLYTADNLADAHLHLASILRVGDVVLYENDLPDNFK